MALPSGYTKLEYIESTGTQYIDTGVSAPAGMRVECQAEFTSLRSGLNMLFGSHDAADPYYRNYLAANSAGNWELGAYGVAPFGTITTGRKYSIDVCTISGDIFAKIDGMAYYIGDIAPSTKRSSLSVYLFALHYAGGLLWASAKLYGAKIYLNASGGNPIRDFIPCKNASGAVGMWDDANGQFYTNAGTGAFMAGPEVKPALTAHKMLVNGTAYTVQGGKCLVNGTSYSVKKGRTLINGTGYDITFKPSYDPVFANNTWEQIIAACHNNEVPETWKVADQKPMTIGGPDYLIDIIGKNHDDYSDGSGKAPLTFQLHDCYNIAKAMHSTGSNTMGWAKCTMRIEHLPTILKQMPADVQSGIREVNKISANGGRSTVLITTQDSLFLLSEGEVFGSSINSHSGEGTQYDYYKAGNSTVKNFNGSAYDWWERSPTANSTRYYCNVKSTGSSVNSSANVIRGVAFGFCF